PGGGREMEPAQPLDSYDVPGAQPLGCGSDRIARLAGAIAIGEPESRPASRTANGLSMKTAIARVVIFSRAIPAHFEPGHCGERAVVGNIANDGKSGTAVGAVNKGIEITAVRRIEHLPETVHTRRDIG